MKQQQQMRNRLMKLEKINQNASKVVNQYTSRPMGKRDYENLSNIKEILYGKMPEGLKEQDQNITDPRCSPNIAVGCIVTSKNGVFKKSKIPSKRRDPLPTDVFQTVRSVRVNVQESEQKIVEQKQELNNQVEQLNKRIESEQLQQQKLDAQNIQDLLLAEKQDLEDEIARLDRSLIQIKYNRIQQPSVKTKSEWQQDRTAFELQWQQLEEVELINYQTCLTPDLFDIWDNQDEQSIIMAPPEVEKPIDSLMIDNLAREVEELMLTHNIQNPEVQAQLSYDRKPHHNPPMETIEEEASIDVSFLY